MDSRTIVAAVAFTGALVAGVGLGWWHGPSLAPDSAIGAPVAIASPLESAGSGGGDATTSRPPPSPAPVTPPSPAPAPYAGDVFAIGDSVLAGAAPCLARRGIDTDAKQSRQIADAAEILDRTGERLPDRVIVHLGTNGGATASELDAVMSLLGPDRVVLFSTIQLPDDLDRYTYERATNDAIAALAVRYDNVRIFDWESVSRLHADWLYAEGIHMTPEGCRGYANLVEPQIRAP
jgi:hypothetical protein